MARRTNKTEQVLKLINASAKQAKENPYINAPAELDAPAEPFSHAQHKAVKKHEVIKQLEIVPPQVEENPVAKPVLQVEEVPDFVQEAIKKSESIPISTAFEEPVPLPLPSVNVAKENVIKTNENLIEVMAIENAAPVLKRFSRCSCEDCVRITVLKVVAELEPVNFNPQTISARELANLKNKLRTKVISTTIKKAIELPANAIHS